MPSNWISDIEWDEQGRPFRTYLMDSFGRKTGDRSYVSPAEVHEGYADDQRLLEWARGAKPDRGGFLHSGGTWNSREGEFQGGTNWGTLAGLGIGGAIAAPIVAPLLAGLGGSSAAGATTGLGAGEVALTSSALPASAVGSGVGAASGGGGGMSLLGSIGGALKGAFKTDPLGLIGNVGQIASGAAQGSANQRLSESDQLLREGVLRQNAANDQFTNQLRSAEFSRGEQDRQRKAALLMALLQGTQDQTMTPGNPNIASRMPQVTGGARPSNLTGNAAQLLALLGQPGPEAPVYTSPNLPGVDRGGAGESILGGLGLATSLLGALRPKPQVVR